MITSKFTAMPNVEMSDRVDSLLSVLKFTSKILLPKYPHSLFPLLSTLYTAKQHCQKKRLKLKLQPLSEDAFECLVPCNIIHSVGVGLYGNIQSCILVSFNTLDILGVSSCSWVKLRTFTDMLQISDALYLYMVQVVAVPDIEDSVALLCNVSYYNIKQALKLEDNIVRVEKVDKPELFVPYMANTTRVCRLQSPFDVSNEVLDTVLSSYFQCPRYLCIGDIISIDIMKYAPSVFYINNKVTTLYFKVLDIQGPCYNNISDKTKFGYYVLKDFTSLIQSPNEQGFLPQNDVTLIKGVGQVTYKNVMLRLLSTSPAGLDMYRDELLACIQPFISDRSMKKCNLKPLFLVCGPRGVGKREIVKNVVEKMGLNIWILDSLELQSSSPGYTEAKLKFVFNRVQQFAPCILLLKNVEVLFKDNDGNEDSRATSAFIDEVKKLFQEMKVYPVIIIATCNSKSESTSLITPALAREFLHVIYIRTPDETQRTAILQWLSKKCGISVSDDLCHIAAQTSGFVYSDLAALVSRAIRNQYKRLKEMNSEKQNCVGVTLTKADFEEALDAMHAAYSDAIDAPKIPKVSWCDVGGLLDLKEEIIRTIMLPLQHPELLAAGLRRSGILLYGPPGTGKTLLAKAVATECSLNFLSVKGPELLNMYVGQSEENVREVFDRARAASPCIIFFDELDSLAPNRGRSGDSGGVMDRVVSQLLAEMDGLQKSSHLFVIGATNRPDLIDPALLRPGRFDKLLYVGVSDDRESQLSIMAALTRRFQLKSDVHLEEVVSLLPDKLTGADLYSVCSHAWLNAVKSQISSLSQDDNKVSSPVEVGVEDFREAIKNLIPSVSNDDLAYFQQIRDKV